MSHMYHLIIMIIIIVQCCYIVSLWLFWIWKIQECHLYFAPPLPRGFDHFCGAGQGRKGVSQGGAGNSPLASIPGANPQLQCRGNGESPFPLLNPNLQPVHRVSQSNGATSPLFYGARLFGTLQYFQPRKSAKNETQKNSAHLREAPFWNVLFPYVLGWICFRLLHT